MIKKYTSRKKNTLHEFVLDFCWLRSDNGSNRGGGGKCFIVYGICGWSGCKKDAIRTDSDSKNT